MGYVPAKSSSTRRRGTFLTTVTLNQPLCREHYLLRLRSDEFPPTAPGQFVQLQCRYLAPQPPWCEVEWDKDGLPAFTQGELTDREVLLRRPFSLAGRRDTPDAVELDIIYRVVGTGTRWLERVSVGDQLSVLGPLGNCFRISESASHAVVVGGGVGIPPMIYLSEQLSKCGKQVVAFSGVRSGDLLPLTLIESVEVDPNGTPTFCLAEFAAHAVPSVVSTDDGSLGVCGMIGEAFERWIDRGGLSPEDLVVYCCGPEAMMREVGESCISRNIESQLALERHMGCGMGTCQSCIVKIRDDSERGWSYKLCCTDGAVFDARDVIWD